MFHSNFSSAALLLFIHVVAVPCQAQSYPSRTVRIIAPYAAGGPVDIVARMVGQKAGERWKQAVVIDNRAGAGGNIGSDFVAKSPPDGHTLLVNTSAMLISPLLGQKTNFDPINDLIPVVKIGVVPALLIVNASLEVKSVADLIAMARARPGALNFASPGTGTSLHLAAELFASMANVKLTHIPYKGGAQALPQLMAGETQMMFDPITEALPLVKAGRLKVLAISTLQRSSMVPEVPTVAESGVPGYDFSVWYGLFAPAGTPPAIIAQLGRDVLEVLQQQELREAFQSRGISVLGEGMQEFSRSYRSEQKVWSDLIKSTKIKID